MNRDIKFYGLYALLSILISWAFVPGAFTGPASMAVFGLVMAGSMYAGTWLEPRAYEQLSPEQVNNMAVRLITRIVLFFLLPMVVLVALNFFAPMLLALPFGWRSALGLVWMPVFIASLLKLW